MANREDDLRRLRELEQQVKEYTDEDLLREAEELEREMQEQNFEYDIPPGFYEQIIAKGKLIEAERALHASQEAEKDEEPGTPPERKKFWEFWKK